MRVLHAVEAFGGGQLELIRQVAVGGASAGDQVAVAHGVRPQTPTDLSGWTDAGVTLVPMSSWAGRSMLRQVGAARELRGLVGDWRPDIVHLHSSFAGFAGALALGSRSPTVFSPQAFASTLANRSPASRRLLRAVERFVVSRATVTVASSPSEARYTRELGATGVELIENGLVELDEPVFRGEPPTPPLVIAGGRLVSQRQPEACARILGQVKDVAGVLWVGGADGDRHRSGLAALTGEGVEVTGWLPREQALEQLTAASVYLHWTAADGQPLSVLEAMALDIPVVASDIPPCRDLLPEDQVCVNEDEAVALIRNIVSDDELADTVRDAQRSRRGRYRASRMVSETLQLYRRLVSG
jgi:glycosyltransferase involved in cell wall biosynthesis